MSTLLLQPTSTAEWYALVNEAELSCSLELGEELESYLVFLLMRFTGKTDMVTSIVAMEFLNALHGKGTIKTERLREVGDKCLLFSGLFPELAKRRRLHGSYFIDVGQNAYYILSALSPQTLAQLYFHLSEYFVPLKEVLSAMRKKQRVEMSVSNQKELKLLGPRNNH